jgi:hypothetical protein
MLELTFQAVGFARPLIFSFCSGLNIPYSSVQRCKFNGLISVRCTLLGVCMIHKPVTNYDYMLKLLS